MSLEESATEQNDEIDSLSYKDIEPIVEYLVKVKSNDYKFDCYESEDIGQEIRIICFKALSHFDFKKVSDDKLVNFFGTCVDNALKNLKRDKYIRFSSPCHPDCELLHSDASDVELGKVCKRWMRYNKNLNRKMNVKNPLSINSDKDYEIKDIDFEKLVEMNDLKEYILSKLDRRLKKGFIKLTSGDRKSVDTKDRRKIQVIVRKILEEILG